MLTPTPIFKPGLSVHQGVCISSEVVLLVRLNKLIELHYMTHRSSDFYSGQLGYTVRCLNRVTVFHTGETIYDLVQYRLLIEAKKQLIYSNLSVKLIAYELGFNHPDYFCRWFKKWTGRTAKGFRKREQGEHRIKTPTKKEIKARRL